MLLSRIQHTMDESNLSFIYRKNHHQAFYIGNLLVKFIADSLIIFTIPKFCFQRIIIYNQYTANNVEVYANYSSAEFISKLFDFPSQN